MAEVIGLVASGISIGTLVAQIGSSILKLRNYWSEVGNAPETISSMLEEIEVLHSISANIEDDQARNLTSAPVLDSALAKRCLTQCQKAADRLEELVADLGADLGSKSRLRNKWSAAKVVLTKEKLKRYKEKLDGTVKLLSLSHQCYTSSLHQLQHEAMLARLSQLVISSDTSLANRSLSIAVTEDGLYPKGGRKVQAESQTPKQPFAYSLSRYLFGFISYQKSRLSITSSANSGKQQDTTGKEELVQVTAVARAPGWLVRRAWEIQAVRTRNVWNINILSYNVISEQSAVFEYTRLNNVEGVKALFSERRASPFDRDVHGQTLLHIAANYGNLSACRFLLSQGAERHATNGDSVTPLLNLCVNCFMLGDDEEATEAARLFLPDADIDEDYIVLYRGDEKGFTLLLQHTIQPYYKWDTVARESIAHNLIYHPLGITPIVFKKAFFQDIISPKSSKTLVSGNSVAIHGIATVIGHNYAALRNFRVQEKYVSEEHLRGWRELLREFVGKQPNIHKLVPVVTFPYRLHLHTWTPLLCCIHGCFSPIFLIRRKHMYSSVTPSLRAYLTDLMNSGINLSDYGQREKELHNRGKVTKDFQVTLDISKSGELFDTRLASWHLIGFTYGPSPKDWHFWGSEITLRSV